MTKQLVTNLTETEGASDSVVAFVCFKDATIFIVAYWLYSLNRYILLRYLKVVVSL